jgi:hypothetical protein
LMTAASLPGGLLRMLHLPRLRMDSSTLPTSGVMDAAWELLCWDARSAQRTVSPLQVLRHHSHVDNHIGAALPVESRHQGRGKTRLDVFSNRL